jgi:hypothetical protein
MPFSGMWRRLGRHVPEDGSRHSHRLKTHKSYIIKLKKILIAKQKVIHYGLKSAKEHRELYAVGFTDV